MVDRAAARGCNFRRLDQVQSLADLHGIITRCLGLKRLELGLGQHNSTHNLYDLARADRLDGE